MNSPAPRLRIAVLGAGITGLTAAWRLHQDGHSVAVFERSARVGGAIHTHRDGPWLHELGPNSLLEGSDQTEALLRGIGLQGKKIYASEQAKHRYIVRDGTPVAMPTSPGSFIATSLFSAGSKLSLLGEPWRRRATPDREESVAQFVERRLGREFLDYAINPFVGGVYAGDPKRLSVRHAFPKLHRLEQEHGSLIRGALRRRNTSGGPKGRIYSFAEGLEVIPRTLAAALAGSIRLNCDVRRLQYCAGEWRIGTRQPTGPDRERFDVVISAVPAYVLSHIEIDGVPHPSPASALATISHPPVVSTMVGYPRAHVTHRLDGFGLLVPEVERHGILGCLFSSTLFPARGPDDHVALTVFVGGTRQPHLTALDDTDLVSLIQSELESILGIQALPAYSHIHRWAHAIPQYELGYQTFKDTMNRMERGAPGLLIGGNCRDGISLSNCIESGFRLAASAAARTQSPLHT